jgi:hypothetical protein
MIEASHAVVWFDGAWVIDNPRDFRRAVRAIISHAIAERLESDGRERRSHGRGHKHRHRVALLRGGVEAAPRRPHHRPAPARHGSRGEILTQPRAAPCGRKHMRSRFSAMIGRFSFHATSSLTRRNETLTRHCSWGEILAHSRAAPRGGKHMRSRFSAMIGRFSSHATPSLTRRNETLTRRCSCGEFPAHSRAAARGGKHMRSRSSI